MKNMKTYENFVNEYNEVKPKWSDSDFNILIKQLEDKISDAKEFITTKVPELKNNKLLDIKYGSDRFHIDLKKMLTVLDNSKSAKANKLAEDIYLLMSMINTFSEEQDNEISKLN